MHQTHEREHAYDHDHELPTRWQSLVFTLKSSLIRWARRIKEEGERSVLHPRSSHLANAPVIEEMSVPLWTQLSPAEFPLTAGKVQNLRISARAFNGVEIPAGQTFSFWRQLGRTQRHRGFVAGRELRAGCVIPNVGGGLCQLSGLLYGAALDAGFEIIERHAHSRKPAGTSLVAERDATVFWNYVDLRFRAPYDWRLEVELTATDLVVRIRGHQHGSKPVSASHSISSSDLGEPEKASASGDCLTCNQTSCFRHPGAVTAHGPALGHTAFLLDARWPELDEWCASHARAGDLYLTPLDGHRWRKSNYSWTVPAGVRPWHATLRTIRHAVLQRHLPVQGASRQRTLLAADEDLALAYAKRLRPECRHLVISQNLLPFLWKSGVLGGRTFDILMQRWPMEQLLEKLDQAAAAHPDSPTLTDFRPTPWLVAAEEKALSHAARLITPHRAIAAHFGSRAILLDWHLPKVDRIRRTTLDDAPRFFFPASPLGRKGICELAAALRGSGAQLDVLGRATEGGISDVLHEVLWHQATLADLPSASALVLPAWIEHQPRLALHALALGIPVVATADCGLPEHVLLHTIPAPDSDQLRRVLRRWLGPQRTVPALARLH